MVRYLWTICLGILVLAGIHISAQTSISPALYGDEWIITGAEYYKFFIDEEGIYRVSIEEIQAGGLDLSEVPADHIHIYSLGQSVPLRTSQAGILKAGDFIEFFARTMDGSLDQLLYTDGASMQLNPHVSLYGKRRPYYIVITDQVQPNRYVAIDHGMDQDHLPPLEPYYMHRERIIYEDYFHKPTYDGRNFIRYSSADIGEGIGSRPDITHDFSFSISELSPIGIKPSVKVRFATNAVSELWEISSNKRFLRLIPASGYRLIDEEISFDRAELEEGAYGFTLKGIGDDGARAMIAVAELRYPRKYQFDGRSSIRFHQQGSIINRLLEIHGYVGKRPIMYNITTRQYIYPVLDMGIIRTTTGAAFEEHEWMLVDQDFGVDQIEDLQRVSFVDALPTSDYLIITHHQLDEEAYVSAYADYRASASGGGYDTHVAYMNQLTDRYAYGVEGHPLAIKNALRQLRARTRLPNYTFLIGKGLEYDALHGDESALVPTLGIPGSDNLYLALSAQRHPLKPIGRLAAQSSADVRHYLQKIISHEHPADQDQTAQAQAWKKEIIHLSGGSATNQTDLFRYLENMAGVIENNAFGAEVITFRKTTADPLQRATTEEIMSQIDGGAALLTFFGHSAVGTFDFSLEDPAKYNNVGRNPIILSLGCHSGNVHTGAQGISEEFVLQPETGAIAFIASSGTAYPEPQFKTGQSIYDLIGGSMYGRSIGDVIQASLEMRTDDDLLEVQTLIEQLTLHGDPAFRPFAFEGPDYIVDPESVRITPNIVDASTDRLGISFDVINLGKSKQDALDIQVVHALPDGTPVDTQMHIIPTPANRTTITTEVRKPTQEWIGNNKIFIHVDPNSRLAEMPDPIAEINNELVAEDGQPGTSFFVFDNSAKPIYPVDYGIHNDEEIILRAAVQNGLNPSGRFAMEIDTTETFDSPIYTVTEIANEHSLIEWKPNIKALPGHVYYWRIAPIQETVNKASYWQGASFIYEPDGPNGWHQSHYYQWLDDDFYKLGIDEDTRQWAYDDREWDIRIKNEVREDGDFWVYVNNTPWSSLNPKGLGSLIQIFVWDREQVIITNNGSDFGSLPFSSDSFLYRMDDEEDAQNVLRLLSSLPRGARVFFHTVLVSDKADLGIQHWASSGLIDALHQQGATRIDDLMSLGTVPYTFIYDKDESPVIEDVAQHIVESIDLTTKARARWQEGKVSSVLIETPEYLDRLVWSEKKEDGDESRLLVIGITASGRQDTVRKIKDVYEVDLRQIPTKLYPNIMLVYETRDEIHKTAPILNYWRVISDPLPDIAFTTSQDLGEWTDTASAGELVRIEYEITNLGSQDMESTVIKYVLIDESFERHTYSKNIGRVKAYDSKIITEWVSTDLLSGHYQVVVELNPGKITKESSYCNNLGYVDIYVIPDHKNPFIDVTFDGKSITNGTVVGQYPTIDIQISDPSSYLLLDDISDWEVTLYYPELVFWQVDTHSHAVSWHPATDLSDNVAHLILRPNLNVEGTFTLEVQARDRAGNFSGTEPFRIQFRVDLAHGLPKIEVGPNPVVDYVDFRYLMETDDVPQVFRLSIFTADGIVIHQAGASEFGGLHRGINTYRWYPRTYSGMSLPTGVYYYELVNSYDTKEEKPRGSLLIMGQ